MTDMRKIICSILCLFGGVFGVGCVGDAGASNRGETSPASYLACLHQAAHLSTGVEVCLRVYYPHLDRTRGKAPSFRTGYWPYGKYYYVIRLTDNETEMLKSLVAKLRAVPGKAQDKWFVVENQGDSNASRAYVQLSLLGHHLYLSPCDIADIKKSIVRESDLPADEGVYYLPDADYQDFMELHCVRKAYALLEKYRDSPAPYFVSEETGK